MHWRSQIAADSKTNFSLFCFLVNCIKVQHCFWLHSYLIKVTSREAFLHWNDICFWSLKCFPSPLYSLLYNLNTSYIFSYKNGLFSRMVSKCKRWTKTLEKIKLTYSYGDHICLSVNRKLGLLEVLELQDMSMVYKDRKLDYLEGTVY